MNKKLLLGVIAAVILAAGLIAGIFLVRQSQDIRSKATGCDSRWPADPGTTCGRTTQFPAQGTASVSLTPDFHWDYGGYRTEDNGQCVQPTGCGTYAVSVYLTEGSPTGQAFARADIPAGTTPVKDAAFSSFKACDYGNVWPNDPATCHTDRQPNIPPLKPNTTYYWKVTPFFDGVVHAEQTWNYNFTTGSPAPTPPPIPPPTPPPPAPIAACQRVSADKDLATIKIGDTVTFTGSGIITNPGTDDAIDKIQFIVMNGTTIASDTTVDTVADGAGVWKATQSFTVKDPGSYSVQIKVHSKKDNTWKI